MANEELSKESLNHPTKIIKSKPKLGEVQEIQQNIFSLFKFLCKSGVYLFLASVKLYFGGIGEIHYSGV